MKTLQILGDSAFGGATRLVLDWCKYLVCQGCEVDVLTTDERTITEFKLIAGVNIHQGIFIPRDIEPIKDITAVINLVFLLKQEKYHVVHTYSATPGFTGRLAGFLSGTKVLLHHQAGWTVNEAKSKLNEIAFQALEGLAIALSSNSICVSHAIRKQADALPLIPKSKLVTICNGIKLEKFVENPIPANRIALCEDFNIRTEAILIGNTGRLATQKDNATLIRAFARLIETCPQKEFKLFLAGDGPERLALGNLAKSLNVSDNVIFLGFRSDIPEFLSAIDVFVSLSLWEGLSISVLEAMAAFCPIVASSILPNSELIENEVAGLLVPTKSPVETANAIMRLIENPGEAKQFGQAARERVLKHYTIDRMFEETYRLYNDLLIKS